MGAFACCILIWALIDEGPSSVAFDLAVQLVAAIAMLIVGAILGLTLSGILFVATFALACLRGRSLTEAGQASCQIAGATLRRFMECSG